MGEWRADAHGNGMTNPQNIDNTALAAAKYLCADNRNLASGDDWLRAILSYNNLWVPNWAFTSGDLGVFVYHKPPSRSRRQRQSGDGAAGGGKDISGAAWFGARCGGGSLKCVTYSVSTAIKMAAGDDQYPVEQFTANRSNSSLGDRVRPGCAHRGAQDSYALAGEHGFEHAGGFGVAVPDQNAELGRAVAEVHKKVACMLGHPGTTGVGGDSQEVHPTGRVLHHEQHIQPLQQQCLDAEEIGGENAPRCTARNCRQLCPSRRGAGSIPALLRTDHTVLASIW